MNSNSECELKLNFPFYIDPVRKVQIPHYVHPKKNGNIRPLFPNAEDGVSSVSDPPPVKGRKGKWSNRDIEILLDYVEANCDQWQFYKAGFYRFLQQNVLKHKNIKQMQKQLFTLLCRYRRYKAKGKRKFEWYDRMHEIFKDRKEPHLQEITKTDKGNDPHNSGQKLIGKKRKQEELDTDSSPSDEEESTSKKKKLPLLAHSRRWSCEEMNILLDFIMENVDAFVENNSLFWSWMSHNVLLGRAPMQIRRRYVILSPTCKYGKRLEVMKVPDELIAKRDRCFDLIKDKNAMRKKKRGKNKFLKPVTFKFPKDYKGYAPSDESTRETVEIESTDTESVSPRYVDIRQNITDIMYAKHLMKYSLDEDVQLLRKCFGGSSKMRWPGRLQEIGVMAQRYGPIGWSDDLDEEEFEIIGTNDTRVPSALYFDDEDGESRTSIQDALQPPSGKISEKMMDREIGLIMNLVSRQEPENGDNADNEWKHSVTDSVMLSLRKTLNEIGLLCSENTDGTMSVNNPDASKDEVIKWDTVLRAASMAKLPPSVIWNTYERISKYYDQEKKFSGIK
ncbi:9135_t:CDS:2 [Acaulospora morrowiae]|uniref:9135_t:CDS:1 n=1 Tax=Acaulospora morrowiae TaxID=94023 RepID=A0A9N9H9B8_9GLOM|nr:9135_t:CDS:2 [Acaulospora morrowiae]